MADERTPERPLGANPFEALRGRYARGPERAAEPAREERSAGEGAGPPRGRVVVRREKKGRGGKTVTRLEGLGLASADLEALARDLKRALGCGASVEAPDILLQGALTDRAAELLRARGWRDVRIGN